MPGADARGRGGRGGDGGTGRGSPEPGWSPSGRLGCGASLGVILDAVDCALSAFSGLEGPRCTLNLPTGQTKAPVETDFNFYLLKTGCLFY